MIKVLPEYFVYKDQPVKMDTAKELTAFLNVTEYKCFVRM